MPRALRRAVSMLMAMSASGLGLAKPKTRCVILPGNGCSGNVRDANWYGWLEQQLIRSDIFDEVVLRNMPDPNAARESIWVPFIRDELIADGAHTVVVGHSSGAVAAMRLLEKTELMGVVLISACHTDLGDAGERRAGYYSRKWEWDKIQSNCKWAVQFHSDDDPFIPAHEADHVASNIKSEYHFFEKRSHFFSPPFPELVEVLRRRMAAPKAVFPNGAETQSMTMLGFGSLLSEASARTTFPDLQNFRFVRVPGWRRVFGHAAAIFFERGIARKDTLEFSSLSAEPASADIGFIAACFEVDMDAVAFQRFEDREEEFDLVIANFESADGHGTGVLCSRSSDAQFRARWGSEVFSKKYKPHVDTIWDWAPDSGLKPCPVYLRHCVLAATKAGPIALDSFLDETFLVDRKTTLRGYLDANAHVMQSEPPASLVGRYSG
ncbi:Alpha/Beta hydrolase protein [Pelagophyceae sp. CCMP2097]|nr:Alpha/Beta hydrolase protein [Pelagophyceae sp. CCMP2097]